MAVTWEDWSESVASGVRRVPDESLARAAEVVYDGDLLLTAGNGGSAALASHAAQAFLKPDYRAGGGHPTVCLNDATPAFTAHANDGGWEMAFLEVARPFLRARTVVLLISSSGRSKNIAHLAMEAQRRNLPVIAFTGFDGGPLRQCATLSLHVDSNDYEVIEPVHDALLHRVQYHFRRIGRGAKL